jgi:hypothetical protein
MSKPILHGVGMPSSPYEPRPLHALAGRVKSLEEKESALVALIEELSNRVEKLETFAGVVCKDLDLL